MNNSTLNKIVEGPFFALGSFICSLLGLVVPIFMSSLVVRIICLFIIFILIIITAHKLISLIRAKKGTRNSYFEKFERNVCNLTQCTERTVCSALEIKKANRFVSERHFSLLISNICSAIKDTIVAMTGEDFNVCIKSIATDSLMDSNIDNWRTKTIAREGPRREERARNDRYTQLIRDNTSFLQILNNSCDVWASNDLDNTKAVFDERGDKYLNPDKKYKEYYKSTIVAPIRIHTEYVSQSILDLSSEYQERAYHYLGFLCVDSLHTFSKDDKCFANLTAIVKLIANGLYPVLENKLVNEIEH